MLGGQPLPFVAHGIMHADTDEAFFVIQGRLRIDLPGGAMHLDAGETVVVPRARSDAGDLWF